MTSDIKRILIVKLSSLGDLLHALPAVHCLKAGLKAQIDWIVHPPYVELVKCFSDVSRVFMFPRLASPAEFLRCIRLLRAQSYDLILDLQGILKSALVSRLGRGSERIGPSFHRECSILFYSAVAGAKNKNRHAVDEIMDAVRYLGLMELPRVFPISVPLQPVSESAPRIALLPFSRWRSKDWPLISFTRVARELQEHLDASIYIMGGPGEQGKVAELARELSGRVINLVGKTSLRQLAGLLREMNLVIANDSGPMHMASAMGARVLALYGPTDPGRTGPCGSKCRVLKGKLLCQPCFSPQCRYRDNSCMLAITPEAVIKEALVMLSKNEEKQGKSGQSADANNA